MKILITGGAGYIGSVTNKLLTEQGVQTVIFDNLSTGHKEIVGTSPLVIGDLTNKEDIRAVFGNHHFDAVVHFAAKALAGESMDKPGEYFRNNILGGINLLEAMKNVNCRTIIFSSTCAVYGTPKDVPVTEKAPIHPESVYASSKRIFEEILEWYGVIYGFKYVNLRYFNASGASLDGNIGEAHDPETHIIPIALSVAKGAKDAFELNGDDYPTADGTCIRDYIHVLDLADAHIKALDYLQKGGGSTAVNLGVGKGYSNRQVLSVVEKVTGKKLTVVVGKKRPGDPAAIWADNTKAKKLLGWKPKYSDLATIVSSAWKWHSETQGRK